MSEHTDPIEHALPEGTKVLWVAAGDGPPTLHELREAVEEATVPWPIDPDPELTRLADRVRRPASFVHLTAEAFAPMHPAVDAAMHAMDAAEARRAHPAAKNDRVCDDDATDFDADVVPFNRNRVAFALSREAAIDYGFVQPTEAERLQRAAESEAFARRRAEAWAQPGPALTVQALLGYLGWSEEFAAHVLHPACDCAPLVDDPYYCSTAREQGLDQEGHHHGW